MAPPNKQKTKIRPPKMTTQTLLDFDLGESSSDSDFRIEDHTESDDDFSDNSNEDSDQDDDDDETDESDDESESDDELNKKNKSLKLEKTNDRISLKDILEKASAAPALNEKIPTNPICCACLGDRSDDTNEIVECDGCGVSVHEGCYGVSDSTSVSSTVSSCSTEPWFCEACRAGITNPSCELCPNKGGIFKETDVGKWVHLVCALYVPGVAFGEVDQLSSVTLFEMPYSKWGAKTCSLCEDAKFARTGVCIGCDAGMCKTYFHVTCAQAAGFLSEAHSEEADHADPFYAHCKVHSDKSMIKHRKRNYNILKVRMEQRKYNKIENQNEKPTSEKIRIQRKLTKYQTKYKTNKILKNEPWVPTQKMPRLLTTSATACRRLMMKAELMGIDTVALEFQEAQMAALADVRRKWHVPPAFSVEFIGYYLDRITRLKDLKSNLEKHLSMNKKLLDEQQKLREEYDQKTKQNTELLDKNSKLKENVNELHKQIQFLCPDKTFPSIDNIGRQIMQTSPIPPPPSRPMSVPTAAALKMGVGFPLINLPAGAKDDSGRILSTQRQNNDELVHECGICKKCNDQHLLAKCDTCHFYYHLSCLNPPLTRHPKKSKLYGWQCSECDKSDESEGTVEMPKGPRKSRTRFSKDGTIIPCEQNNTSSNTNESNLSIKSDTSITKRRKSFDNKIISKKDQNQQNSNDYNLINLDCNKTPPPTKGQQKEESKIINSFNKNKQNLNLKLNNDIKSIENDEQINPLSNNLNDCIKNTSQRNSKEDAKNKIQQQQVQQDSATEESATESTSSKITAATKKSGKLKTTTPTTTTTTTTTMTIKDTNNKKLKRERLKSQSQDEGDGDIAIVIKKENTNCNEHQPDMKKTKIENCAEEDKKSKIIEQSTAIVVVIKEEQKDEINNKLDKEKNTMKNENIKICTENTPSKIENRIENVNEIIKKSEEEEEQQQSKIVQNNECEENEQKKLIKNKEEEANNKLIEQQNVDPSHKQNRKKRKDKHKNKYGSDHEKSPGKEHKRKRKKKSHDRDNTISITTTAATGTGATNSTTLLNNTVPKIKIKLKPLPLPGEAAPEPQFFYVSADMVCDNSRPTSVETIDESTTNAEDIILNNSPTFLSDTDKVMPSTSTPNPSSRINSPIKLNNINKLLSPSSSSSSSSRILLSNKNAARVVSPRRLSKRDTSITNNSTSQSNSKQSSIEKLCCVCSQIGSNQNLVQCDECGKNYHFTCLDPPLKKTPKRRGYSWHCADCDPTDHESI